MANKMPLITPPEKDADSGDNIDKINKVIHEYDIIDDPETNAIEENDHMMEPRTHRREIPIEIENSNQRISSRNRLSSSDRSSTDDGAPSPTVKWPRANCKEKIIVCVDVSAQMETPIFRSRAGDKLSSKQLLKRGLSIFCQSKQQLDRKHEVALILLEEQAIWARDFTNNHRDIMIALEDVIESHSCETCDLGSVFDTVLEKVELPCIEGDVTVLPPPFTVRLILLYGRSNCPLEFSKEESFKLLNSSPYFFLDAIYLHEPLSNENRCQEVFDSICDLDQKGVSYILDASRNPTKVYDAMSQLLAHPLQRPAQNEASHRIGSSVPQPENG